MVKYLHKNEIIVACLIPKLKLSVTNYYVMFEMNENCLSLFILHTLWIISFSILSVSFVMTLTTTTKYGPYVRKK